jgi:hypothetical protein
VSFEDKVSLLRKGICTIIKLTLAFCWQEEQIKGFWLTSKFWNKFAGQMLPLVNKFANWIGGWEPGTQPAV